MSIVAALVATILRQAGGLFEHEMPWLSCFLILNI